MTKYISLMLLKTILGISLLAFIISCSQTKEDVSPRKMEILFLGHESKHHNAIEFMPYLAAAVTPKGINLSYTSDPKSLNPKNLENYDGIILYANHDEIKPSHEKALLDFVKNGGGFIPIHSASYCFRNSDDFVALVGAQFESHDTASFSLDIVNKDHPITQGLVPFETWDETYVHTHHSKKDVLMERVEGDHREPYTWVKKYGKGRVFYTALGHDLRTWGHPGFQDLIYRGILWAIGDAKKAALDSLTFPTLQYTPAKIANYEKRDPAPQLQAPLSPEESMKLIQIPPQFELQLFASEPDIINPIAMNWDEKGRLWILETVDYPNEINTTDGVGNDRIKICEDTDNDGKADKFTVFAENLSVPTSLVFARGGVIVSQAPQFLFFKDTDGDDVADVKEVLIEGWGTSDTHAGPSNLRYGFDNNIWGVLGYSGFEGKVGQEDHKFSQGIYRFSPDGSELEYMSRTSNNTWGLGFSEENDIFISTANNTHSGYYGIPDVHVRDVEGLHARGIEKIDGHYLFHPITRNFRQVDVFGGFTAAAGHALYTARSFPEEYWNRIAFVSEPTGHLLHNAIVERKGAGFEEKDGWNLLSSADEWVSPVAAEVGPDGAVWVLDWYNFIIQHNPTPPGFENGFGNAHINPLRDKQRGRIYKVVYKDAPDYTPIQLEKDDTEQLLATLSNDNLIWRMHAQRLLVEGGKKEVKNDLIAKIADTSKDHLGLNNAALHAIWTLHGLGLIKEEHEDVMDAINGALSHPATAIRKAAVQALPDNDKTLARINSSNIFKDESLQNRLAAINKLWSQPTSEVLAQTIVTLAQNQESLSDVWLARAIYLVAVKHKDAFVLALLKDDPDVLNKMENKEATASINFLDPNLDISDWKDIPIPMWLSHTNFEELTGFNGIMWYRGTVKLAAAQASAKASMHLPGAWAKDFTFINGKQVGTGSGWDTKRNYKVNNGILKPGKNNIAIKIEGGGGVGGDKDGFYLQLGADKISLAGTWKYKIEKIISSGRSEYADGDDIITVFLKNYGPYAASYAQKLEQSDAIIDKSFIIKTIKDQMKYDVTEISASTGDVVEIVFINNDAMQHNLLVVTPGSLRKVGMRAEEFAKEKLAAENHYKPEMEEILFYTPLLNPGEEYKLRFKVPDTPGDYPFVCTFPGHWQTMNGVIKVQKKVL